MGILLLVTSLATLLYALWRGSIGWSLLAFLCFGGGIFLLDEPQELVCVQYKCHVFKTRCQCDKWMEVTYEEWE